MTKEVLPIAFSSKVFELTVKAEDVDGKFGEKIWIREQLNINFNELFHFILEGNNAMIWLFVILKFHNGIFSDLHIQPC